MDICPFVLRYSGHRYSFQDPTLAEEIHFPSLRIHEELFTMEKEANFDGPFFYSLNRSTRETDSGESYSPNSFIPKVG